MTQLAKRIRISRAQLYLDFENPGMSFDRILAIGQVLHHDFSLEFKDLSTALTSLVNQEPAPYVVALDDCRTRLLDAQSQLITALREIDRYKERYGAIPTT